MRYFPCFTDLYGKRVLIFGGGKQALEKILKLQPFGCEITVISKNISDEIMQLDFINIEKRSFMESDLDSFPCIVVAAEERETNERLCVLCRQKHIMFNAVDCPDICDFIFPAVIATDSLCIGISSAGASPSAAIELKKRIQEIIPDNIDDILFAMPDIRERVKKKLPQKERHNKALKLIIQASFENERPLSDIEVDDIIMKIK